MRVAGYARQIGAERIRLIDNVTSNGYHMIGFFIDENEVELLDVMFISKQKWAELEKLSEKDLISELLKAKVMDTGHFGD